MIFSEIKPKIKNLGDYKTLTEIKKAGLRVVKIKAGDFWLIEAEFLKPVIKSPKECKSIIVNPDDLKFKVLMCQKTKNELKGRKILEYISWGEKQGFNKKPTTKNRQQWFIVTIPKLSDFLWTMTYRERFFVVKNRKVYADARFYDIYLKEGNNLEKIFLLLNSSLTLFFIELFARGYGGGGGPIDVKVYEVEDLEILKPGLFQGTSLQLNTVGSVFTGLGFDKTKSVREQEPKPLPDRKALDDIVFDVLGLTQKERKEVYWAVAELVQNRLSKAKNV